MFKVFINILNQICDQKKIMDSAGCFFFFQVENRSYIKSNYFLFVSIIYNYFIEKQHTYLLLSKDSTHIQLYNVLNKHSLRSKCNIFADNLEIDIK